MIGDERNKKQDKEMEELEAFGQDDDKQAVKDVTKIMKEKEKQEKEQEAVNLDQLSNFKYNRSNYNHFLSDLLIRRMSQVELQGWNYRVKYDDIGVYLEIKSPKGRIFGSAFRSTGEAMYDLNAVHLYGTRAENTIDRIGKETNVHQTN